ncbi:ESAT-6 protein secretion system EspG family protein [Rhodococcus sp. OK519]|uniref:ESX secretion-associated protein EspG n=1 Tax=Rhodococcus sp. OK519 TaxID=2135729 RepID=UPI000D39C788|nr:ESAT-6 protein secretion system EspG family protein [Rhodococcus sp. OK519]
MAVHSTGPAASGNQWRFTGLEFQILWRRLGLDRLPYPLRYRPIAQTQDDLVGQRRAASEALLPRLTERLHRHLVALAEPTIRIEVFGLFGSGAPTPVRMHAGISGSTGVLAIQLAGADLDTGSDILLHGIDPARVPDAIASALPSVPTGSRSVIRFRRDDLRPGQGSVLVSAGTAGIRDEALALLGRPRRGMGEITAFAGAAYDSRPTDDGIGLHWLDFDGDGRYTLRGDRDLVVRPTGPADVAADVRALVDAVRIREVSH